MENMHEYAASHIEIFWAIPCESRQQAQRNPGILSPRNPGGLTCAQHWQLWAWRCAVCFRMSLGGFSENFGTPQAIARIAPKGDRLLFWCPVSRTPPKISPCFLTKAVVNPSTRFCFWKKQNEPYMFCFGCDFLRHELEKQPIKLHPLETYTREP